MKCPKCQYISFESGDRCRNCGYEFSLAADAADAAIAQASELAIKDGTEALGPLADFSLHETPNLPLFTAPGDPDPPRRHARRTLARARHRGFRVPARAGHRS